MSVPLPRSLVLAASLTLLSSCGPTSSPGVDAGRQELDASASDGGSDDDASVDAARQPGDAGPGDAGPGDAGSLRPSTPAELAVRSAADYADNQSGLIAPSRLVAWLTNWENARPPGIQGDLVILQLGHADSPGRFVLAREGVRVYDAAEIGRGHGAAHPSGRAAPSSFPSITQRASPGRGSPPPDAPRAR